MDINLTSASVREIADRITKAFPDRNKPEVLEMLAIGFGYRDFNTLSGLLKKEGKAVLEPAPNALATQLKQVAGVVERDLYVECSANDEWAEYPSWVRIRLTRDFLTQVLELSARCREEGISEVVTFDSPDGSDPNTSVNHSWELVVDSTSFYFRGHQKSSGVVVENRAVYLSPLLHFLTGERSGEAGLFFTQYGEVLFYGDDAYGLSIQILEGTDAVYDDVAEWVGLHYQVNYDSLTSEEQADYDWRYLDMHQMKPIEN